MPEEYALRMRDLFSAPLRHMLTTTMPQSIYHKLQRHSKGISGYYEEAIIGFDGDLQALLEAAAQFIETRKRLAPKDPSQTASGRVSTEAFQKVQKIQAALAEIRGISRAKVICGLVQLRMQR